MKDCWLGEKNIIKFKRNFHILKVIVLIINYCNKM